MCLWFQEFLILTLVQVSLNTWQYRSVLPLILRPKSDFLNNPEGHYYAYETSHGIAAQENGASKNANFVS